MCVKTLLLDDDQIFLTVAETCLASLGAEIVKATTEAEIAFDIARTQNIDLIAIDLNMPELDGLAVLRTLSEMKFRGALIIISGEKNAIVSSAGVIASKMGLKICGAISKPLNMANLSECYQRAVAEVKRAKHSANHIKLVQKGDLKPFYEFQPQINIHTGKLTGVEALLRGYDDNGQVFGPQAVLAGKPENISDAEFSIQLFDIFCSDVAAMRAKGFTNRFSFNADASTLESPNAFELFRDAARAHELDPSGIVIELIESHLPKDEAWLLEVMARLGIAGFEISMDDFATGASSFDLLRAGAFSEVKLDASLIQKSATDSATAKFIAGVVEVAKELDIRLIAEGVECTEDVDRMRQIGVEYTQGYFIAKPTDKDDLQTSYPFEAQSKTAVC
jgi:EAL domain-containing protein (putative c-di-GMP-specific phosphodiesterase class I)